MIRSIFGVLTAAAGFYSLIILARIIISWFGNMVSGKPVEIIKKITDPYLDWWKKFIKLRIGFFDFSVIAAIVFLYFLQNIFYVLSVSAKITLGFLLTQVLSSLWNILSFIIIFYIIIIIIRGIGYLTNSSIYSPFWTAIDSVSQPFMYRMNRLFFGNKTGGFLIGILLTLFLLIVILVGGSIAVSILAGILSKLPI